MTRVKGDDFFGIETRPQISTRWRLWEGFRDATSMNPIWLYLQRAPCLPTSASWTRRIFEIQVFFVDCPHGLFLCPAWISGETPSVWCIHVSTDFGKYVVKLDQHIPASDNICALCASLAFPSRWVMLSCPVPPTSTPLIPVSRSAQLNISLLEKFVIQVPLHRHRALHHASTSQTLWDLTGSFNLPLTRTPYLQCKS